MPHQSEFRPALRPPFVCSLQEEFNFEEALKRFNKEEIGKEAEEEHVSASTLCIRFCTLHFVLVACNILFVRCLVVSARLAAGVAPSGCSSLCPPPSCLASLDGSSALHPGYIQCDAPSAIRPVKSTQL